jgi:hypothetical protein
VLSFDRGNYDSAVQWLGDMLPNIENHGLWQYGARYNLARSYEASGKVQLAIETLESTPQKSPQRHGNLLRARQLRETLQDDADSSGASEQSDG